MLLGYVLDCILLRGCPILVFFFYVCVVFGPLVFSPENVGGGGQGPLGPPLNPRLTGVALVNVNYPQHFLLPAVYNKGGGGYSMFFSQLRTTTFMIM